MILKTNIKATISEFWKNKTMVNNFLIMWIIWLAIDTSYSVIQYHDNFFPGDDCMNTLVLKIVEFSLLAASGYYY